MKRTLKRTSLVLVAAVALAVSMGDRASADAPTRITSCNTVIIVPGRYALANDLVDCPYVGIDILASHVTLLLNGHTISGSTRESGIHVGSRGGNTPFTNVTILGPGVITNFQWNVFLEPTVSFSTVSGITITGGSTFLGYGFVAYATNTVFTGNTVSGVGNGFLVAGNNSVFKGNDSSGNGTGFAVYAAGNEVRGNTVNGNLAVGIFVNLGSAGNTIRGNTALGNNTSGATYYYDLEDDNVNCDSNIWHGNEFGTANQACIQ